MGRPYNDTKLKLGEPWAGKVNDFLKASHNGQFVELVRRAVDMYIDTYVAKNPGFKKDYDAARTARIAGKDKK